MLKADKLIAQEFEKYIELKKIKRLLDFYKQVLLKQNNTLDKDTLKVVIKDLKGVLNETDINKNK